MQLYAIGQFSLSVSFLIYCFYFLPQIWHNRKPEYARRISHGLQLTYVLAYSADWLYGAAAHLEWQYRWVSLLGIVSLCYQQWQIRPANKNSTYQLSCLLLVLMIGASLLLSAFPNQITLPTTALGLLSMLGSVFAFIPQLISNYKSKSGLAINHGFIAITLICAVLDMISAVCLQWPWPSWVSPPLLFVLHSACWWQQSCYRRSTTQHALLH